VLVVCHHLDTQIYIYKFFLTSLLLKIHISMPCFCQQVNYKVK